MALRKSRYVPYAVHLVGAAAWINQIYSTVMNSGTSLFEESTGSQTDRAFVAIREINPVVAIQTSDAGILGTIGFGGLSFTGATAVPTVLYGRELPLGGLPSAVGSANHVSCTISDGLLVPVSYSGAHNAIARLSIELHALLGNGGSSGATPLVYAKNVSIATGDLPEPATNNMFAASVIHFTTGASSPAVSPRLLEGITEINVSFGIGVFKESTDSDVYPSYASIPSRMPRVEFGIRDADLAIECGDGLAITAFDTYFQRVLPNGQRSAKSATGSTLGHVKISHTAGILFNGSVNLTHKSPAGGTYTFVPAGAAPLTSISTTSAIPTTA